VSSGLERACRLQPLEARRNCCPEASAAGGEITVASHGRYVGDVMKVKEET
jgi:hypothetical protein